MRSPPVRRRRPRLASNWRTILRRAWSIRLLILAGLLSGAEVALPLLDGSEAIPRGAAALLSVFVTAGALVALLLAQQEVSHGK
jgi:hypothetical protein